MMSTNIAKPANSQSVSYEMRKSNAQAVAHIKATLKDCSPKQNHHFCPPVTGATLPGTSAMARAKAAI
jgi:hypothetical protein